VTDGETNASLRKGDAGDSITLQRAVELLAERRAAAPSPRRSSGGSRGRSGGSARSTPGKRSGPGGKSGRSAS
jgi:DNA topoisomerase I